MLCCPRKQNAGGSNLQPTEGAYVYSSIVHFDTTEQLQNWLKWEARLSLVNEVKPLLSPFTPSKS